MNTNARTDGSTASRRSLSQDLTQKLIITVSAIFIVTSLFNFWVFSYKSKALYTQKASEYLDYLKDNLEVPLWNMDRDWVESICRSFSRNETVALLRVLGEDGTHLFDTATDEKDGLIKEKSEVFHEGTWIGTIELGLTTRFIQKSNYQFSLVSVFQMLLVVLGLVFSTKLILNRSLGRPLKHLISRIEEISTGKYGEKPETFGHFEIARILDKFNHMANVVKTREDILLETNKKLEMEIAERKEAEKALSESENRYRQLVEYLPVGLFRASPEPEGRFLMVNPALAKMFGCRTVEEFSGTLVRDIYRDPEMRARVLEILLREGSIKGLEIEFRRRGSTSMVGLVTSHIMKDQSGNPLYIDGVVEDITERKDLERHTQQALRMEAIGTLAGGIAHDFNNILSSIFGFAEAAKMRQAMGRNVEEYLDEILSAGLRARSLVRQILAFSRQSEMKKISMTLGPIVKETIKFLRASLPTTIEIRHTIEAADSVVLADPTQIHQILMNLCTNSAHAMEKTGGILEVRLDESTIDSESGLEYAGLKPGGYLRLTVIDTGEGIAKEIMGRIFEPFFTTKPRGEGTGMGLAMVHGIVKDLGGGISVMSEPGKGAVFHVFLPKQEGEAAELLMQHGVPKPGKGKILFVDDEEGFIVSGSEILEQFGYEVAAARSAPEALGIFKSSPDEFDLVITDMIMPKMTGLELAKQLNEIRSGVPIILCTGFSAYVDDIVLGTSGIREMVMKPLLAGELADVIERVLGDEGLKREHGESAYHRRRS